MRQGKVELRVGSGDSFSRLKGREHWKTPQAGIYGDLQGGPGVRTCGQAESTTESLSRTKVFDYLMKF